MAGITKNKVERTNCIPPSIDRIFSEIARESILIRCQIAHEKGDFRPVLEAGVQAINGLATELELAAQRGELLTLMLSSLELSYFILIGWGKSPHRNPPTWMFDEILNVWAIDVLQEMLRPEWKDKSKIPGSFTKLMDEFKEKHGIYGIRTLLSAIQQFIRERKSTSEIKTFVIRGGNAASNDGWNTWSFCEELEEFSRCIALYIDDFQCYKSLYDYNAKEGHLVAWVIELMLSGRFELSLQWLELDLPNRSLGSCYDQTSIINLRIFAARKVGNREVLLQHLENAYITTFAPQYFSEILSLFSGAEKDLTKDRLLGLAETAPYGLASEKAFMLLLEQQVWTSLQRMLTNYQDKEIFLVGDLKSSLSRNRLLDIIEACQEHAPQVANHLRQLQNIKKKFTVRRLR